MADYLLFESPIGYSLFKVALQGDAVGNRLKEVQEGVNDLAKFGKMIDLASFLPFEYVFNLGFSPANFIRRGIPR